MAGRSAAPNVWVNLRRRNGRMVRCGTNVRGAPPPPPPPMSLLVDQFNYIGAGVW